MARTPSRPASAPRPSSKCSWTSISQARRAAGFLPFAFAFAGGMGVLARLVGPILLPLMLGAGMFLQIVYPGDFEYVLKNPAPAWIAWFAVVGALVALAVGFWRRRPALETGAALVASAFLTPVIAGGLLDWRPPPPPEIATLSGGLVHALRDEVIPGDVVFSDPETSFRLAAFAPVYIATAPPGHVADTEKNRPYERARDARRFLRTGDVSIPENVARELEQAGKLDRDDFLGTRTYVLADGSKVPSRRVLLREVTVGGQTVSNVTASISRAGSPPRLGQSFLSKFASWTLDNERAALVLKTKGDDAAVSTPPASAGLPSGSGPGGSGPCDPRRRRRDRRGTVCVQSGV